jgi:hypothetical protein
VLTEWSQTSVKLLYSRSKICTLQVRADSRKSLLPMSAYGIPTDTASWLVTNGAEHCLVFKYVGTYLLIAKSGYKLGRIYLKTSFP